MVALFCGITELKLLVALGSGGSVSIVRRFDSPKIQLKLKLALTLTLTDTGCAVLTLTDTGDLRTIEPSDYRADTGQGLLPLWHFSLFVYSTAKTSLLQEMIQIE